MINWIKKVLQESNGTPSSIRLCLLLIVVCVIGCAVYICTQHALHSLIVDIPKNLTDLLSVAIGALSAAKLGSKFGESKQEPPQE
jgi:hypothetical protein